MRSSALSLLRASFLVFFFFITVVSSSLAIPTHLDKSKIVNGCGGCHKGHGKKSTEMLVLPKEELCFKCHGSFSKGASKSYRNDVYSVLLKESSHMLIQITDPNIMTGKEKAGFIDQQKQVTCRDCHKIHRTEKGNVYEGVKGYQNRQFNKKADREYEICYKCHSENIGVRSSTTDVSIDFNSSNRSYHPVETFGRNSSVPSLKKEYSTASLISCSDCHGNDDKTGPAGPHGSKYAPILKDQYIRIQAPENPYSYALCYLCHDRNSIINDQSFKAHKSHIVYNQISCAQCHSAHGSRINASLIKFDSSLVFPNTAGQIAFLSSMPGKPRCYLTCHINGWAYEHKLDQKMTYSVNSKTIRDW